MKIGVKLFLSCLLMFLWAYNIQAQTVTPMFADCSTGLACPLGQYCNKGVCMPRPICRAGNSDPEFYKNCREVKSGRCNNDAECEWGRVCNMKKRLCENQP